MARGKWTTCLECFEKSPRRKAWWCVHCGHLKPKAMPVTSLGEDNYAARLEWAKVKDMTYSQWLAYKGLERSPKSWDDFVMKQFKL